MYKKYVNTTKNQTHKIAYPIHIYIYTYVYKSIHMSAIIFNRLSRFIFTINKFLTPILVSACCIVNILCFVLLRFFLLIFISCFVTRNMNTKFKSNAENRHILFVTNAKETKFKYKI